MDIDFFWFVLLAIFGGQAYLQTREPKARARRALARASRIPIGDVKAGAWVKVAGVVAAVEPPRTSPFSGRECIGYWCEVDDSDRGVIGAFKKDDCSAFSIEDDTGRAIVDGPFLLAPEIETEWSPAPEEHVEFLQRIGVATESVLAEGRVREALLRPGDRISVLGLAFLEPDPASPSTGFRAPPLIQRLRGSDRRPIILGVAGEPTEE